MTDRRTTLQWMLAAAASGPLLGARAGFAAVPAPAASPAAPPHAAPLAAGKGYGTDPKLLEVHRAGTLWPLTFSAPQRQLAAVLCDLILPASAEAPAASAVGVVDFIDEWISAPYATQQHDRPLVLAGLAWLDSEAAAQGAEGFAQLGVGAQRVICDALCDARRASGAHAEAARFFARYRDLTAGAYYSSPAGRKDIGYVGNVALTRFEGPPPELLRRLGLDDTGAG